MHSGIVDVIVIDRKPGKRRKFGIVESGRQVAGAEEPRRRPIAESEPSLEQRLLELRNGKSSERQHRAELQQLTALHPLELPAIGSQVHLTADDAKDEIRGSSKSDVTLEPFLERICWLLSGDPARRPWALLCGSGVEKPPSTVRPLD